MYKYLITVFLFITSFLTSYSVSAAQKHNEFLVKFTEEVRATSALPKQVANSGSKAEILFSGWVLVKSPNTEVAQQLQSLLNEDPNVDYIQPNYTMRLLEDYRIADPLRRAAFARGWAKNFKPQAIPDNLVIPEAPAQIGTGADPLYNSQWGMKDIGAEAGWKVASGAPIVVAVIDTGVDYTHEDLLPNMWRNPGEIANNNIDDDHNGFVDDIVGWDFKSNDNKPYDLTTTWQELLTSGGNPGHGTHCAGNVAARGDNGKGISGVAPQVKIMALRFLGEKGGGTTADGIKAIKYAVDNGAQVLSNSWGSEGEDPSEGAENKALRDIIQYSQDHGTLFIAAAGNGHNGKGYDNDSDKKPGYPASYENENIISVAALDVNNRLGGFSNWGAKTVDIGAPGVNIFSTTVGNKYSDKVLDIGGFEVAWDGTSMATPHVAGAAALYWSKYPTKSWSEVKAALLSSVKKIPALSRKVTSEGKLDIRELMK
jgi:thermitase